MGTVELMTAKTDSIWRRSGPKAAAVQTRTRELTSAISEGRHVQTSAHRSPKPEGPRTEREHFAEVVELRRNRG